MAALWAAHLNRPVCPNWVISGQTITAQNPPLSALVRKRTNAGAAGLSGKCQ
jgi:hypothetical protein